MIIRPLWHVIILLLAIACHFRDVVECWHIEHESPAAIGMGKVTMDEESDFEVIGELPEVE